MKFKLNKKLFLKQNSRVQVAIILGILILVNAIFYNLTARIDLTQNNDYSISSTTKRILKELDDIVTVNVYFSDNLPGQFIALRQEVGDILESYENYSRGKVKVNFLNPQADETTEQNVQAMGIQPLQFNQVEKDQYQVMTGYLGMAISYADKKEVLPVVQNTITLEYDLTGSIKKVTSDQDFVIGITQGHGERSFDQDLEGIVKNLEKQYQVEKIEILGEKLIDDKFSTLIIAGPSSSFGEKEKFILDQFLMQGKSILFLLDGVLVNNNLQPSLAEHNLNDLLENYGIKLNQNLVLDVSNTIATFSSGYGNFITQYPFWVKGLNQNFSQDSALVNKLESITLPWASSAQILSNARNNAEVVELVKTTSQAWEQASNFDLNPQGNLRPASGTQKQFNLAIFKSGELNSFFKDKENPLEENKEVLKIIDSGRIIFVGDSDFTTNSFLGRNQDNLIFMSNLVDGLTKDLDLVNIRSKGATSRPLKDLSDGVKSLLKYLNIFLPTLIIMIFGFIRFYLRKKETEFR